MFQRPRSNRPKKPPGSPSRLGPPWLFSCQAGASSQIAVKTEHIGQVGNDQGEDQRFLVHGRSKKIDRESIARSMSESRERVPKSIFRGIQILFTAWSPPGDS